jgi:DNA helicase-2/ATP-dependent DNA helicase PcrA
VEYEEESEDASLEDFLDRSALVADADEVGQRPGVTLMTVHCAKGLEYPIVFVAGLEENLFPHPMSSGSDEDLEEERRLCYVAMTRAKQRLLLSHAGHRRLQGTYLPSRPSRFLDEIPHELIQEVSPAADGFFGEWKRPAYGGLPEAGSSAARAALAVRGCPEAPVRPRPAAAPAPDGYSIGAFVLHPRFGSGQILDREGGGKHLKLTIQFTSHGRKKILPAYTKLQIEQGPA